MIVLLIIVIVILLFGAARIRGCIGQILGLFVVIMLASALAEVPGWIWAIIGLSLVAAVAYFWFRRGRPTSFAHASVVRHNDLVIKDLAPRIKRLTPEQQEQIKIMRETADTASIVKFVRENDISD